MQNRCNITIWLGAAMLLIAVPVNAQRPDYAECRDWQGKQYSADVRIRSCTAAIQSGRWSGRGLVWVLSCRGHAYLAAKDYDRAIMDFSESIRLNPHADIYTARGVAYFSKGQYDRAIQDYDEALRLNPNSSYAITNRAAAIAKRK